jgi:hypothetical protein
MRDSTLAVICLAVRPSMGASGARGGEPSLIGYYDSTFI